MKQLTLAIFAVAALAACDEARPCTVCPDVGGDYLVEWTDGGSRDEGCIGDGPRPASWALDQQRDRLVTSVNGTAMGGTLYESFDLLLKGGPADYTLQLRAVAVPGDRLLDGGTAMELRGTFTTRTVQDTTSCEVHDTFSAHRQ